VHALGQERKLDDVIINARHFEFTSSSSPAASPSLSSKVGIFILVYAKQSKAKQNKTKQNKTKQSKAKQKAGQRLQRKWHAIRDEAGMR
jgi:hypothetical protein